MGDRTKNISRHELACSCGCGFDSMDGETLDVWQDACDHFAKALGLDRVVFIPHSGARCFRYNRTPEVGSNDNSQHPLARALDGHIVGVTPLKLYTYLTGKYKGRYGFGLYTTFVHVDTRTTGSNGPKRPARW